MLENPEDYYSSASTFAGSAGETPFLNEPLRSSAPPAVGPDKLEPYSPSTEEEIAALTSSTKLVFREDKDGMMMESSCVLPRPNAFVPIPSNPKKIRSFQKDDGIGFDAAPTGSLPIPNPVVPLGGYKRVSFVQDSSGNMVLRRLKPTVTRPGPNSILNAGGGDVDRPDRPTLPPTAAGTATTTSATTTTTRKAYAVDDGISIDFTPTKTLPTPTRMAPLKLESQMTPPSDKPWRDEVEGRNADSGLRGPKQPTLLWEQRPTDFTG
jgi:hypothetical protein